MKKQPLVKVDQDIMHYPFFKYKQRTAEPDIVKFFGGYWEFYNNNLDLYDLDVFLAIFSLYQTAELHDKIQRNIMYDYKFDGKQHKREAVSFVATRSQICKVIGLTPGGTAYNKIDKSLKKLSAMTAFKNLYKEKKDKTYNVNLIRSVRTVKLVATYDRSDNDNIITFDADFVEYCKKEGLLLRYQTLIGMTGQLHKALFLFITGSEKNLRKGIPEQRIFNFLGLRKPYLSTTKNKPAPTKLQIKQHELDMIKYRNDAKELRRQIKNALKYFVQIGAIFNYMTVDRLNTKIYKIGLNNLL